MTDPARAAARQTRVIERLGRLVACPSVGADPAAAQGMEDARRLIEGWLAESGWQGIRRLHGGGAPAIFAERMDAPGRPTLIVYAHYDVQPADPVAAWTTPPFVATRRDGRIHGRGTSDDKGPLLIALEAMAALVAAEGRLPVNVKLLIEGEEETGSPSLPRILRENAAALAADAVLSADGARWRPDLVSVNVGARGTAGLELTLRTAGRDLHSGRYGGMVPNALHLMARLIASLHDGDGRIAVPGFLDGVAEPSPEERAAIAAIPFDAGAFLAPTGAMPWGEAGHAPLERLWLRPTIEVNGMWGGHLGAGAKTVIPHEAHAKITMRLVPGQDPAACLAALKAHLVATCPPCARLHFGAEKGQAPAWSLAPDHPLLAAAEAALEEVHGTRPLRVRIGASLPVTALMRDILGIDTVMLSYATADENIHAPDEFLRESAIGEGIAAWIATLRRVGGQDGADYAAFRGR